MAVRRWMLLGPCAGLVLLWGCTRSADAPASAEETDASAESTGGDTSTEESGGAEASTATTEVSSSETGAQGCGLEPVACGQACDAWDPDDTCCGPEEKCQPVWGCQESSISFDATVCQPLMGRAPLGAPCRSFDADDCDAGLYCFDQDPDTGFGRCHALCTGGLDDPQCPAEELCVPMADGLFGLCRPTCDPLDADACLGHRSVSEGCFPHPNGGGFICTFGLPAPYGARCSPFDSGCNAGVVCVDADHVPSCDEDPNPDEPFPCCTVLCDLAAENTCPDAALGQTCVPFYPADAVPPGYESVGICGMPTSG